MDDPQFSVESNSLNEVLKKEAEWKELLTKEIQDLSLKHKETREKLNTTTNQLCQLKEAFFSNFKLLKRREAEFCLQRDELAVVQKNLLAREVVISELKASLDRCKAELGSCRTAEAQLRRELELQIVGSAKRESELHKKHTIAINALKQSEAQERARLQSALTRVQADLEAERVKAASDLEEALGKAAEQAEKSASEASQKQFGLQLRVQMLEEMYERTLKSKKEALENVELTEKLVEKTQSELQVALQNVESLTLKITEAVSDKEIAEQKIFAMENAQLQAQNKWSEERKEILSKLESTKSQLGWQRKEMAIAINKHEELSSRMTTENQRLLEDLTKEREETRMALKSLEEANKLRHLAERKARNVRSECERLRRDLEQALLASVREEPKSAVSCDHKHLIAQLEHLQVNCDRLEEENTRLKRSISVMSEQAKQTAHSIQLNKSQKRDDRQKNVDKSTMTNTDSAADTVQHAGDDTQMLREKLQLSVGMIRTLVQEKHALKELSNRLQARVRQLETEIQMNQAEPVRQPPEVRYQSSRESVYLNNINSPHFNELNSRCEIPTSERNTNPVVPPLPLIDLEDAVSSVRGRESVSAMFRMMDANTPTMTPDIRSVASDRADCKNLYVRGRSKPVAAKKRSSLL